MFSSDLSYSSMKSILDQSSRRNTTIAGLRPETQEMVARLGVAAKLSGLDLRVGEAYRSYQRQYDIWAPGRVAGRLDEPKTFAAAPGRSLHEQGRAVDVFFSGANQEEQFSPEKYKKLYETYTDLYGKDIRWGGNWKSRDMPHFETRMGGLSSNVSERGLAKYNLTASDLGTMVAEIAIDKVEKRFGKKINIAGAPSQTRQQSVSTTRAPSPPANKVSAPTQAQAPVKKQAASNTATQMSMKYQNSSLEILLAENKRILGLKQSLLTII